MKKDSFRKQSIHRSLRQSYYSIIGVFVFLFLCVGVCMTRSLYSMKLIANQYIPAITNAGQALNNQLVAQNATYKLCLTTNEKYINQYIKEADQADMDMQENLKKLRHINPKYKDTISSIQKILQEILVYRSNAILYCHQGQTDKALELLEENYFTKMSKITKQLEVIRMDIQARSEDAVQSKQTELLITMCIFLLLFLLILRIAFYRSKQLIQNMKLPLDSIGDAMELIANGNLQSSLMYTAQNEYGDLADKVRSCTDHLNQYVENISYTLDSISNHNLDLTVEVEYQGQFIKIKKSLNRIIEIMNDVFYNMRSVCSKVDQETTSMSLLSREVANGSLEQSASIQNMTASIQEFTHKVEMNTESVIQLQKHTNAIETRMKVQRKKIDLLESKMKLVTESNQKIIRVISLIDGISEQTSLLALNARIEASRAMDCGAGFQVVAEQITKLAQQTKDAVDETKQLVNESILSVNSEVQSIHTMNQFELTTINQMNTIYDCMSQLVQVNKDQSDLIIQYRDSIQKIATVVQNNADLAVTLERKSEELTNTVDALIHRFDSFRMKERADDIEHEKD